MQPRSSHSAGSAAGVNFFWCGEPAAVRPWRSQINTVVSRLPEARSCPSGENARAVMIASWPRSTRRRWPVASSQISMSLPPTARSRPSGEKARQALATPLRYIGSGPGRRCRSLPVLRSQMWMT